jgi:hypothetical protein
VSRYLLRRVDAISLERNSTSRRALGVEEAFLNKNELLAEVQGRWSPASGQVRAMGRAAIAPYMSEPQVDECTRSGPRTRATQLGGSPLWFAKARRHEAEQSPSCRAQVWRKRAATQPWRFLQGEPAAQVEAATGFFLESPREFNLFGSDFVCIFEAQSATSMRSWCPTYGRQPSRMNAVFRLAASLETKPASILRR